MEEPTENPPCPECGSVEVIAIRYGYPSADMLEQVESGSAVMGGCLLDEESPTWLCKRCGAKYGRLGPM